MSWHASWACSASFSTPGSTSSKAGPNRNANLGITAEDRKEKQHRDEIAKLKAALADKTLENDFFRSALLKVKEGRQPSTETGASASTTSSGRGRKSKAC